jgi:pimeloyl-ACP methyl ester carboxylesterase
MKARVIGMIAAATLIGSALRAQSIAGVWQGTIAADGRTYRSVLKISKADSGWAGAFISLDEVSDLRIATNVVFKDGNLTVTFPPNFVTRGSAQYEGKLGTNGHSFVGTWIQPNARYSLNLRRTAAREAWELPPRHTTRFIGVDTNVTLEVLDWGGSGPPLVFLSGLGGTAHHFDLFAPKFTPTYHVYGITRRGFGASSAPAFTRANYVADRLADDVLAVIDSLGLRRPVLVGHSIAGEELSSIGSRYPDRVAGLIYLEAGYGYAFYDASRGDYDIDRRDLLHTLERLQSETLSQYDRRTLMHALRDSILPQFERDVDQRTKRLDAMPSGAPSAQAVDTTPSAARAILDGAEKYTRIAVPILAIFALPYQPQPMPGVDSATRAVLQARVDSFTAVQATAFENGVPSAHVVRIPNATHFIFRSNEADVLREMKAFLAALPR